MEFESDDPVTIGTMIAVGVGTQAATSAIFGKGGGGGSQRTVVSPAVDQQPTKTAAPVEALSEEAKKKRIRFAASELIRRFGEPILGSQGLTGA